MYSVYYVIIVTGIGVMLFEKTKNDIMQLKLQNLWNELSEYDTVQSTVLVDVDDT